MKERPRIVGMGMVTDAWASVGAFAESLQGERGGGLPVARARMMAAAAVQAYDTLTGLAVSAAHQAISLAGLIGPESGKLHREEGEGTGLLVVSAWGAIDATVAYLDSMLEGEGGGGRYASPRHFSRSVYSSVASLVAIHFGIHGPCETLSFPARPIMAALERGRRLLAAGRCERVLVIWADQRSELAADLAKRAATRLGRREYGRYVDGKMGQGAVAVLLGKEGGVALKEIEEPVESGDARGGAYPMDAAVGLMRRLLDGDVGGD